LESRCGTVGRIYREEQLGYDLLFLRKFMRQLHSFGLIDGNLNLFVNGDYTVLIAWNISHLSANVLPL